MQDNETVEWDPYNILDIDRVSDLAVLYEPFFSYSLSLSFLFPCYSALTKGATTSEIKRQYRLLSKTHHPDKGGDPEVFTKIAKAYEAYAYTSHLTFHMFDLLD